MHRKTWYQLRNIIPIEKRVTVTLWNLSTGNSFRTISRILPSGKFTAVTITCEFCTEIFKLSLQFIKFPISQLETAKTIGNFKQDCNCKIPQALGAIDGTYILRQTLDNEQKYDYYCGIQHYSINNQAVVGLIISWCCNWLSKKHAWLSSCKTFLTISQSWAKWNFKKTQSCHR